MGVGSTGGDGSCAIGGTGNGNTIIDGGAREGVGVGCTGGDGSGGGVGLGNNGSGGGEGVNNPTPGEPTTPAVEEPTTPVVAVVETPVVAAAADATTLGVILALTPTPVPHPPTAPSHKAIFPTTCNTSTCCGSKPRATL